MGELTDLDASLIDLNAALDAAGLLDAARHGPPTIADVPVHLRNSQRGSDLLSELHDKYLENTRAVYNVISRQCVKDYASR